jgi:hypothetical protein
MAAGGKIRSSGGKALQIARAQAARLLRTVLRDDRARLASASIKSLIYLPSVRNKKATMALLCQTLKCKFPQHQRREKLIVYLPTTTTTTSFVGGHGHVPCFFSLHRRQNFVLFCADLPIIKRVLEGSDLLKNKGKVGFTRLSLSIICFSMITYGTRLTNVKVISFDYPMTKLAIENDRDCVVLAMHLLMQ